MTSNGLFQRAYPTDLRGLSPLEAGGGKIYPVDPEAVRKLREFHEQKAVEETQAKEVMARLERQLKAKGKKMNSKPVVIEQTAEEPATAVADGLYSAEVRAAAAEQMAKEPTKRRYGKVLTPAVLDIWQRWIDEGKSPEWIAENNGLIPVTSPTVRNQLANHRRDSAKTAVSSKPPKAKRRPVETAVSTPAPAAAAVEVIAPETAVSEPEPVPDQTPTEEPEPVQNGRFVATKPDNLPAFLDHDNRPAPRPLDGLAALLQLVQSDQVRIRGSVKLNIEVDFGDGGAS